MRNRIKVGLLVLVLLAIFIVFGLWSGVPTGERARPFWMGVAVLFLGLAAFGWATWHLMFRPLPAHQMLHEQPINARYRYALALLLGVGMYSVTIGAFWDEVWHRQYGIPFGEDFFWRPHLLIYFGIAVAILLAFTALYFLLRQGQGTLRQRFRANPVLGFLILAGALLMFVLPVDPLWHEIYGEDLSAWAIPHLLLWAGFNSILLLTIAIHMTTQPRSQWKGPGQLGLSAALPLLMFAAISLTWNQFFVTEWDGGSRLVSSRPDWLLPLLIAAGAAFVGVLANHTLRSFGAATLTGLLALSLRFALVQLFNVANVVRVSPWMLALPSLVLIDLWYVSRRRSWIGGGAAAALGMWLVLLTVFERVYPAYPISDHLIAFALVLTGNLGTSWVAAALGDYFAEHNKGDEEAAVGGLSISLLTLGACAATAAFIIVFVLTASPPQ